jgi:hypothetical protein
MTLAQQATQVSAPAAAPINPAGQSAQALPGFDAGPAIDAHESNLADYLNQPVHNALARLGLPGSPQAAPPADAANRNGAPPPGAANSGMPGMLANLMTQMIQPVTDALGTLGPGMFGSLNPTQTFGGISQALGSAGQSVQQAMGGLGGVWQGNAASAAGARTSAALANGAQVASQATALGTSLSAVVASVQQAEAQLVAIINEFSATIAAIGPNIIFPWGIAAAIAAANNAVTMATGVMTELQGTLVAQAAHVTAIGAPVSVTSAPQVGTNLATSAAPTAATFTPQTAANFAVPTAAASAPAAATSAPGSAMAPMMMQALAMPAMEGVSAATGALQGGGASAPAQAAAAAAPANGVSGAAAPSKAASGGGIGSAAIGGGPLETIQSRLAAPPPAPITDTTIPAALSSDAPAPAATGGAPMMGGAPMGRGARAGVGRSHNAADFLHTFDQGDEIVGNLGSVAPPVIGVTDAKTSPDIELRI